MMEEYARDLLGRGTGDERGLVEVEGEVGDGVGWGVKADGTRGEVEDGGGGATRGGGGRR